MYSTDGFTAQNSSNQNRCLKLDITSTEEPLTWDMFLLISYNVFVLLVGLLGNCFVLYAVIAYKELANTCRISLLLIKHLTACDVLCLLLLGIPALSTYICKLCLFQTECAMCYYTTYLRPALTSANFKFVFLISIHRLIRCYKPHTTLSLQPTFIEIGALVVYCISAAEVSLTYMTMKGTTFTISSHGCFAVVDNPPKDVLAVRFVHVAFTMLIPFVGTIATNVGLWVLACRASHKFDLRPLITVSVISGFILVSWLPFIIYMFQKYIFKVSASYAKMEEIAFNLVLLSMCSNPVVYTVFNKSLLGFLKTKISVVCRACRGQVGHMTTHSTAAGSNSNNQHSNNQHSINQHSNNVLR
ncbi:hypothetical protein ACHWQZ_G017528 [Mnemiopsis leidyi]